MDHVSDSDAENSLPLLTSSAVDKELLRDVYLFFSLATRAQIRTEARNSSFASIYDEIDSSQAENGEFSPRDSPHSTQSANTQSGTHSFIYVNSSQSHNSTNATQLNSTGNEIPVSAAAAPAFGRSLRKRTFSSRHPYIADQADWLGICTVDSINEMFSDNDDIIQVCKALNKLYLQKKKRFPDEDRYRSKNFYAHLGNSKMLALQGDAEEDQEHIEATQELQKVESDLDSLDKESDIIPYDGFEIPYSPEYTGDTQHVPDDNDILDIIDSGVDLEDYEHNDGNTQEQVSESSESEAEEQLIRIGGRYRKLSTILRGVLPESAKRLGLFEKVAPRKKRRTAPVLAPRKGLAVRKIGTALAKSTDLEQELSALAEKDKERIRSPSPDQATLQFTSASNLRSKDTITKAPLLRTTSLFGYKLETPNTPLVYISSGSDIDSDIETVYPEKLLAITPGYKKRSSPRITNFDDEEVIEVDAIDRLLSSRRAKQKPRNLLQSRVPKNSEYRSLGARTSGVRTSNAMPSSSKPLSTSGVTGAARGTSRSRRPRKYQHRLGGRIAQGNFTPRTAFRRAVAPQSSKNTLRTPIIQSVLSEKTKQFENGVDKKQEKSKKSEVNKFAFDGHSNVFRRNPVIATSAFEVEDSEVPLIKPHKLYKKVDHPQLFVPSKDSLLSLGYDLTSLIGTNAVVQRSVIESGHIFFHDAGSVSFSFMDKQFDFDRIDLNEANKNLAKFFALCRRSLSNGALWDDSHKRLQLRNALKQVMRWLLISKDRPNEQLWKQLRLTLEHFSKLQTKEVRLSQSIFHTQLLYILWILAQLEVTAEMLLNAHRAKNLEKDLFHELDKFTSDFWVSTFQTFSGEELTQKSEDHLSSVALILAMYEHRDETWWPPMTEALEIVVLIEELDSRLLNIVLALAAMVKKEDRNWGAILTVLNHLKQRNDSSGLHYFIDLCLLLIRRLSWKLEERVLLQLYAAFAVKKFANFPDESEVPPSLGFVRTRQDIPDSSAFERFMGLTYEYLSELGSIKEAKKLISKLLATSQYKYVKGRKSQIMFVNRINLIVLFSQISEVDMGNQYLNFVEQIKDSHDAFVYGRSLDALELLCEVAKERDKTIPIRAFRIFFEIFNGGASFTGLYELYKRFLSYVGFIFQGTSSHTGSGVFDLLEILGDMDLSKVADDFKLDVLGITFLSTQELSMLEMTDMTAKQQSSLTKFNESLLKFTSTQMNRLPFVLVKTDELLEELIEFSLQIWIVTSKLLGVSYWNVMMLQKYQYMGDSMLRNRFIMFFCVEYLTICPVDNSFLIEIDKVLLLGLLLPNLSKYALDLYVSLSKTPESIFCLKSIQDINSKFALRTYRLQIITRIISNIGTSSGGEKDALLLDFVKRLHEEYTQNIHDASHSEMGKRIMEQIGKHAHSAVEKSDEFWELSAKMGLPNKWMHENWKRSDDTERVYLLNREFLCALAVGKENDFVRAMDNWIDEDNNHILYALIQVYCSALTLSNHYWAHVSYLLEFLLHKLKRFQIAVRERALSEFLSSLVDLAAFSRRQASSKYILHELHALNVCAHIFEEILYIYNGYRDRADIVHMIAQFSANIYQNRPQNLKIAVTFTDITVEKLRQYQTIYHAKPVQESDDVQKAMQDNNKVISMLATMNNDEKTLPDFLFEF